MKRAFSTVLDEYLVLRTKAPEPVPSEREDPEYNAYWEKMGQLEDELDAFFP